MRILSITIVTALVLTLGMFGLLFTVLIHGGDILEFTHPSRSIKHSTDKGVFIDTLDIIYADTIDTKRFENISIWPTISWIEKKTYWKSGAMDLDSMGIVPDTVVLIINFKSFVDGREWAPNSGYTIGTLQSITGDEESVYIDENTTRINLKMFIDQVEDTIRLTTKNKEQIILKRRN